VTIKITSGLDLPLAGQPTGPVSAGPRVSSVALLGRDYVGLRPRLLVKPGDAVTLGQPLFVDKRDPTVHYVAPGTGLVSAVHRGNRRRLLSVTVDLDPEVGGKVEASVMSGEADPADLTADEVRDRLCRFGLWTALRARPFGRVPPADSRPRSIFVTAIDTHPLAANPAEVVAQAQAEFTTGLNILGMLTDGPVHLCTAPGWQGPLGDPQRVRLSEFAGPHPAGLAGTHIHFLDPVAANRVVWHIGYQDVIAFGRLFRDGVLDVSRVVALGGPGVKNPRLMRSRLGASADDLCAGELVSARPAGIPPRLISGPVLSGRQARGAEAYLGRYHQQLAAVPEDDGHRWFGWLRLFSRGHSFSGLFRRHQSGARDVLTTAAGGVPRTLLPAEAFEKVMPLDILPVPLLRALLIRDTDQAQALGCLELDAEDLALCSYVCPGKLDYGSILRVNLAQIEREG
jgi:Na+-transporting NADH:ubiquinone oxidoreductase subunit A